MKSERRKFVKALIFAVLFWVLKEKPKSLYLALE